MGSIKPTQQDLTSDLKANTKRISMEESRDIQQGGSGRARLRDGEGDTVMTGGSNADAFVVTVGQDLMTDFSWIAGDTIDHKDVTNPLTIEDVQGRNGQIHTVVSKSAKNLMAFQNRSTWDILDASNKNENLGLVMRDIDLLGLIRSNEKWEMIAVGFTSTMTDDDSGAFQLINIRNKSKYRH